ncbi:MAG: ABC transporter permease [Propionibacteriaceae bacterium]|nr:ABC transporter permease [Propionibacteriaceae bacterium]
MTAPHQPSVPSTRLTYAHVLRSEWTKFWSVPSTWWTLGALVVVIIGFGLISNSSASATAGATIRATQPTSAAFTVGQLVMAILAVLVITGEFTSGEIKTSLLAAPGRWRMLAAKAAIVAVIGFAVTFVAIYIAMLCGWPMISSFATDDRFTAAGLRVIAGAGLGVALVAVMALGIGTLVRNGALAIGIVVVVQFILMAVFGGINIHWMHVVVGYLPAGAIRGLSAPPSAANAAVDIFTFGKSLWVSLLWAFVPLLAGAVVLRKSDI